MAVTKTQTCSTCGHAQDLPAVFCGACNAPLLKISKAFLLVFLTLTVGAFVYFGAVRESLLFAWPLYAYFALLFVVLNYAVTRRHPLLTVRMVAWSALLGYALWFFYLGFNRALMNLTSDVRDVVDIIEQDTFAMVVVGLVLLAELVLAFVLLVKRFGFATGYRVYATLLAMAALAGRYAFSYAAGETGAPVSVHLSDWFSWAPATEVKELFELVAVNIMRAMLAEIAVTSFIKAHRPAGEAFQRYQAAAKPAAPPTGPAAAMLDAASRLNAGIFRAALLLRHFFGQFARALATYVLAFGRTLRRLFLDLLLPAASLALAALLLGMLTEHSATYITGQAGERLAYFAGIRSSLVTIGISIVLLFMTQLVFLAAVTKFSFRALWRCNSLLMMWIAPFVIFLFLFVSLSLRAVGLVQDLPYRLGILTASATVLLVLMTVYAAIAGRRASARMAAAEAKDSLPLPMDDIPLGQELVGNDTPEPESLIPDDIKSPPQAAPGQ